MEFSNHAMVRYVQRVLGIKNKEDAQEYVNRNKYMVIFKLLKFVNESKLLYDKMTYKGSSEVTEYRLNGDILIVIATNTNTVITIYDIQMDLDIRENRERLREFAKKIGKNRYDLIKIDSVKKKNDIETGKIKTTIDYLERNLEDLKKELEGSIQISKGYVSEMVKLKDENKKLMNDIMYGFKKLNKDDESTY